MKRVLSNHCLQGILLILLGMVVMNGVFRVISLVTGNGWQLSDASHIISMIFGFFAGIGICVWHFDEDQE